MKTYKGNPFDKPQSGNDFIADVSGSYDKGVHLDWWNDEKTDRFAMLKKHGYQDEKKPWKYRTLTNKGIFLMYKKEENG